MRNIGSTIQTLREAKGYTQDQLAEKLFVSRQTISNYGRNKSQPSLEMPEKIAEAFDTDLASLLTVPVDQKVNRCALFLPGGICLLLLAAYVALSPIAAAQRKECFDARLLYWLNILITPLLWASLGYFLLSILVTAAHIRPKKSAWSKAVCILMAAVTVAYLILMVPLLFSLKVSWNWSHFAHWGIGAAPGCRFPHAYLVLSFAFGAALRICHLGEDFSQKEQ